MIYELRRQQIEEPSKRQLDNYLQTIKKKIHGKTEVRYYDLDFWCSKKSAIPCDVHEVFVIGDAIKVDENVAQNSIFKIFMSTRYLKARHLAADSTYKLNYQGFPVFLLGVNDMCRHFHATSLSIKSGETDEDYAFIFSSLKIITDKLFFNSISTYFPSILVADSAEAITNGFITVFLVCIVRVMC